MVTQRKALYAQRFFQIPVPNRSERWRVTCVITRGIYGCLTPQASAYFPQKCIPRNKFTWTPSNALLARMPLSSYSKLFSKLMPYHLIEGMFGVLTTTKLAFTPIVPLPDSMAVLSYFTLVTLFPSLVYRPKSPFIVAARRSHPLFLRCGSEKSFRTTDAPATLITSKRSQ